MFILLCTLNVVGALKYDIHMVLGQSVFSNVSEGCLFV